MLFMRVLDFLLGLLILPGKKWIRRVDQNLSLLYMDVTVSTDTAR